jgi:8-oxo-dGTP pyrophosphatase MutT (NUDIX family)
MPHESWELLGSEYLKHYRVVRLREDRYRFKPTGEEAPFVVCESANWVIVLPITDQEEVVFIRQFRHGVQQNVLEVPGGIVDPGESPEEAAQRELREETGYEADKIEILGELLPNPALNNAWFHVALATGCRLVSQPEFDGWETIETLLKPRSKVREMIRNGELTHAQVVAAFALWEAKSNSH